MNKTKFNGMALMGVGGMLHATGKLLRNRRLQASGFALQIAGQSRWAIGDATLRVGARLHPPRPTRSGLPN